MLLTTFEEVCQEINAVIPIKYWGKTSNLRSGYIEPLNPPIKVGADKAREFYLLVEKHGFVPVESIPSGRMAFKALGLLS